MHTSLTCTACDRVHAVDQLHNVCRDCGMPLAARYPLDELRPRLTPAVARARRAGPWGNAMWSLWELMPVASPADAVSLGEGATPLLGCARRGPFAAFERLYVKDESRNPTGSFKARGLSAAITRAVALGARAVALPSAGNAAGAAAAYAARAGVECHVFVPADTPRANITESLAAGAHVYLVDGLIGDCGGLVGKGCERFGWFSLSTLKEPFRLEGKKTMGYELAFDLAALAALAPGAHDDDHDPDDVSDRALPLPDVILYPTGGGTGLVGMWKAFDEMQALGWIGAERPRMVAVQAAGCCPIVRAFEAGARRAEPFPDAATVASGLRVPSAIGDFLMLDILRASRGTAVAVTDDDLLAATRELATVQGIHACPEAGAVWHAAKQLAECGWLDPRERVVLFNTGSGLKYDHLADAPELPVLDPADPRCLDVVEAGRA